MNIIQKLRYGKRSLVDTPDGTWYMLEAKPGMFSGGYYKWVLLDTFGGFKRSGGMGFIDITPYDKPEELPCIEMHDYSKKLSVSDA